MKARLSEWWRRRHRHNWSEPEEIGSYAEDLIAATGRINFKQTCQSCGKVRFWSESNV